MNTAAPRDYENWHYEHRRHADIEEFRESLRADPSEALHTVGPEHDDLDILLAGNVGADERGVPVFFNGAIPARGNKKGPFFSGGRVGPRVATGYVCISDPAVDRDERVSLGWYTGREDTSTPQLIVAVLDALAEVLERELVLVGGSGGGFAILHYAGRTSRPCSAFVWNPQTDILGYNRTFVDAYLEASFPSTYTPGTAPQDWRSVRANQFAEAHVAHSVVPPAEDGTPSPRRLLYLQNATDWHLVSHAAPFIQALKFRAVGTGSYILDEDRCVQVASWGEGHAPPDGEFLAPYLSQFLDGDRAAVDIGRALALDGRCDPHATTTAPMDLRAEAARIVGGITAKWAADASTVSISSAVIPAGYGGLRFGLVQIHNGVRQQVAWFVQDPVLAVDAGKLWPIGELLVAVRDGFNHHLGFAHVNSEGPQADDAAPVSQVERPAPSQRGSATTFIYGSCVTRDAMTFLDSPVIAAYVARTPVISAMGDSPCRLPDGMEITRVESAFQRRMLTWDAEKALPGMLRTVPHDVVVIDFIDERLATVRVNGGVLAVSTEAVRAGLDPAGLTRLKMTDDRFFDEWVRAIAPLLEQLRDHRVILNRVFWARCDDTGDDLRDRFAVDEHNEVLRGMYDHVAQSLVCEAIDYPSELLVADRNHKWGLSPFHFTEDFYRHFCSEFGVITDGGY